MHKCNDWSSLKQHIGLQVLDKLFHILFELLELTYNNAANARSCINFAQDWSVNSYLRPITALLCCCPVNGGERLFEFVWNDFSRVLTRIVF